MGRFTLRTRIKIGGRKSLLSRIQIFMVRDRLLAIDPNLEFEIILKDSLGDIRSKSNLKTPEVSGIFSTEFQEELLQKNMDIVVHSFKDLDLSTRHTTELLSVLPRGDVRDVLLFKKNQYIHHQDTIQILTSSPRREYLIKTLVKDYFPIPIQTYPVSVLAVRGNIQTRLRKYIHSDASGILVAKAALDRLLYPPIKKEDIPDWEETKRLLNEVLQQSLFMVLPTSVFPTAPAQGAICAEFRKEDQDLRDLLTQISEPSVQYEVEKERSILSEYGGGCHQKIGVSVSKRDYGTIISIRGETDSNNAIQKRELVGSSSFQWKRDEVWPPQAKMAARQRERLRYSLPKDVDLFVSRGYAFPLDLTVNATNQILWAAGLSTWRDLAKRGFWVNGSSDGLGEHEEPNIDHLIGRRPNFVKLTHTGSDTQQSHLPVVPTYFVSAPEIPIPFDPSKIKAAFWRSGSEFEIITERFPVLLSVIHFCGPGSTYQKIKNKLSSKKNTQVYVALSFESWVETYIQK